MPSSRQQAPNPYPPPPPRPPTFRGSKRSPVKNLPVNYVRIGVPKDREHRREQPGILVFHTRAHAINDNVHLLRRSHTPQLPSLACPKKGDRINQLKRCAMSSKSPTQPYHRWMQGGGIMAGYSMQPIYVLSSWLPAATVQQTAHNIA